MRAPLAPIGWPSAMAPPFTLTLSQSHSSDLAVGDGLCGERLVHLHQVDVAQRHAAPAKDAVYGQRRGLE